MAMTGLVGPVFFSGGLLLLYYGDSEQQALIGAKFEQATSDWVIIVIAILVTIVYLTHFIRRLKIVLPPEIKKAAILINTNLDFQPTQKWFDEKARTTIKELGDKYDEKINYPYPDMELLLASLRRDNSITWALEGNLRNLKDKIRSYAKYYKDLPNGHYKKYGEYLKIIAEALEVSRFTYNEYETIQNALNSFEEGMDEDRSEIYKRTNHHSDYTFNELYSAFSSLANQINNPWLSGVKYNTVIVNGNGGIGKSHLLADVVSHRLKAEEPTIFLLGKKFGGEGEPLDQILSKLDLLCKKDVFLKTLNEQSQRVVIVIDGINEGTGVRYWQNHLPGFIQEIAIYDNIELIVSYRSTDNNNWFDQYSKEDGHALYQHRGFEGKPAAIEYMFKAYGLSSPTFPFFSTEFTNPMFLTFYCRSHEHSNKPLVAEGKLDIVMDYVNEVNRKLSNDLGYNNRQNLVDECLKALAAAAVANNGAYVPFDVAHTAMMNAISSCNSKNELFDYLVEENLVRVIDASHGKAFVSFGYETVGDIYIAQELLLNHEPKEWFDNYALYDDSYICYLAPIKEGKEIFEIAKPEYKSEYIDRFINIYPWRKTATKAGDEVIKAILDNKDFEKIVALAINCAPNENKKINGDALTDILLSINNRERDYVWTTSISGAYSSEYTDMALWCWGISQQTINGFDDEMLRKTSKILIWCLASTNRKLRDVSTRALVNLLYGRLNVLCDLLLKFKDVDDLYILDRLWAVAYGCVVNNSKPKEVLQIAETANNLIFKQDHVIDHILILDYAKNIIQYAESIGCLVERAPDLFTKPFNEGVILPEFPTTDYIKATYEEEFDNVPDDRKDEWRAKVHVTDSMKTEHLPRGMYGDFGRYTFQSSLSSFPVDPESLSNWALDMIFRDMGYDPALFAKFDNTNFYNDRSTNRVERIGKKYQWIAMYRIMAILSDVYFGKLKLDEWESPCVARARSLDPTVAARPYAKNQTPGTLIYRMPHYDLYKKHREDDNRWMHDFEDMPLIDDFLSVKDENGKEWINLFSYNTFKGDVANSLSQEDGADRELWVFVQCMVVDRRNREKMTSLIHEEGLEGRHSTENHDSYDVFYREFYWSDLYKSEVKDHGLFDCPYQAGWKETPFNVQPAYIPYMEESSGDKSIEDSINIYMPSEHLYKGLGMSFGEGKGVWLDKDGHLICVDNSIFSGGKQALQVRKEALLEYLKREDKVLVWPILMERTLVVPGTYWPREQAGGYAWMDQNGRIHHKFRLYVPSKKEKLREKINSRFPNLKYDWPMLLHKLHVRRLDEDELFQLELDKKSWYERKKI
jgi:hypothetical protein